MEEENAEDLLLDKVLAQVSAWHEEEGRWAEVEASKLSSFSAEYAVTFFQDAKTADSKTASATSSVLKLEFEHGLGDCANFAHVLALLQQRGYEFEVACSPDKALLFQASGVRVTARTEEHLSVPWQEAYEVPAEGPEEVWAYNKVAINLDKAPLPLLGTSQQTWKELCEVWLDVRPCLTEVDQQEVRHFVRDLPRPLVLVHTTGNTYQDQKSLPDEVVSNIYMRLLDGMDGTLILLDWDDRVPRLASWRVRHLTDDWMALDVGQLLALMHEADLFLGIDSGPLHAARLANIPSVGVFPTADHYPTRFCLPRGNQVNVVPREPLHEWNLRVRLAYNLIECPGPEINPDVVAEACLRMLSGPRYLMADQIGSDVQLQQFARDWERGRPGALSARTDRDRSFDLLLREIGQRFKAPVVVETGCIRSSEDWRGAGYGTYLLGAFLERFGGELISVDIDPTNCAFARAATTEMKCVTIAEADSVKFLAQFGRQIDVLLLDSMDTEMPRFEEHCLREIQAALPWLRTDSIVVFDDTVYAKRAFIGKGALAVPWLLWQGWKIFYSGYQTLCIRTDSLNYD